MSLQTIRASNRDDPFAPEMLRNFARQHTDAWERIVQLAAKLDVSPESVAAYALLLGEQIVSVGLDSDDLLAVLQRPGEGLDLPLIMAKRKTRGERVSPRESLGHQYWRIISIGRRIMGPALSMRASSTVRTEIPLDETVGI